MLLISRLAVATSLIALSALLASSPPARGQQQPPAAAPAKPAGNAAIETIELVVAPAAEPRPALKYRLIPAPHERTPGNAAQYYYRALLHQSSGSQEYWQKATDRAAAWEASDPRTYPDTEVFAWLNGQSAALSQLKVAAFREYCDWDLRVQDLRGMETISFLLHDTQQCRQLARTIKLQAHAEIMDGRIPEAFQTLRLGYQLAHDVAQPPLLINGLVGVAIANMMNQELLLLMQYSQANYYWALTALPQPLVDLRPALQFEMNMPHQLFPFLKDAETAERSPEEWRKVVLDTIKGMDGLASGDAGLAVWQNELAATALAAKLYPVAKQQLIEGGMDRERVEAMPVGQVIAIQTARALEHAYHEVFKLSLLPYDEASRRLPEVTRQLEQDVLRPEATLSGKSGIPVAGLLIPSIQNVMHAQGRLARDFASLQAIEAIRMHAAASDGQLPARLADVTVVPVPNDPLTGQPFAYKLDPRSQTATLDVAAPLSSPAYRRDARRYTIRLAPNGAWSRLQPK